MVFIGGSSYISENKVIAILQYECVKKDENKDYYLDCLNNNTVIDVSYDSDPKSLILTDEGIYVSPISSMTLIKRVDNFKSSMIENSLANADELEEGEFTDA